MYYDNNILRKDKMAGAIANVSCVIQARIAHQRKLEDAREKHKEWWNLDESGRTVGKAAETVNEAGLRRREENRVDASGVTRGGVYGSR